MYAINQLKGLISVYNFILADDVLNEIQIIQQNSVISIHVLRIYFAFLY